MMVCGWKEVYSRFVAARDGSTANVALKTCVPNDWVAVADKR